MSLRGIGLRVASTAWHNGWMRKRSSKKKLEAAAPAEAEQAAGGNPAPDAEAAGKNPAAVALGRLGGKKGGPARAAKLTRKQRSEIAKKAAQARWARKGAD